jgi:AraC-like DNA-binding protein
MSAKSQSEFEIIAHPQITNLNLFVVELAYRTLHLHRDVEINLVLDGAVEVFGPEESYFAHMGDLIVLNPNMPHGLKTAEKPVTLLCLQITPQFFQRAVSSIEAVSFAQPFVINQIEPEQLQQIKQLFLRLGLCYLQKEPYYELHCAGLLNLLAYHILCNVPLRQLTHEELQAQSKRAERLTRLLNFVDEHYTQKICLSTFAAQEKLSLGYLSHFARQNLQCTFQDYVNNVRFNQACKLLCTTDKRLLDICIECGFSDPRYMARAFDKKLGITPETFRKSNKGQLPDIAKVHQSEHSLQRFYHTEKNIAILNQFLQAEDGLL